MTRVITFEKAVLTGSYAASTSQVIDLAKYNAETISIHNVFSVDSSTAKTFQPADVDVTENAITITAHGFETGRKAALTTAGTLPGGLSATDYWVIKIDADTIKLASSLVNALAGTAVDITTQGVGTQTLTPAALSGASVKIQESNVNEAAAFVDISGLTSAITATGSSIWRPATELRYMRIVFAITDGQVSLASNVVIKG